MPITTAPRDGTPVHDLHGRQQTPTWAIWRHCRVDIDAMRVLNQLHE
jgi:hypothetical protein